MQKAMSIQLTPLFEWIKYNQSIVTWLGGLSVLLFLGFLIAAPIYISRLPEDYLLEHKPGEKQKQNAFHIHLFYVILKNILGVLLFVAGVSMLFLPGQGLITIIVGISLLSLPGKKRLIHKILAQRTVLRTVNRIRVKLHKPPLKV